MHAQRGQTMPFWLISTVVVLAMFFFISNYVMTTAWEIHAQNAADSAASAGLSVHANILNEQSTLLYAAAVDEYRIRAVNQGLLNAMNGAGGCAATASCNRDYQALLAEYNALVAQSGAFASDIQLLKQANNFSQGGQQQDERKAVQTFATYDPALTYSVIGDTVANNGKKQNALQSIDVVACRNVPYFGPGLMRLAGGAFFQAVGRAASSVVPSMTPQTFTPTTTQQPTENGWQVGSTLYTTDGAPAYSVNFTGTAPAPGLVVTLSWYGTSPTSPRLVDSIAQATYDPSLNNVGNAPSNGTPSGAYGCSTQ